MTCFSLWFSAALVYCVFSAYTVRREFLSVEVDDIFMYLIETCCDNASVAADERLMHSKGLQATITFILKVVGVM